MLGAARANVNPQSTLFKECRCIFMSSKKAFRSYLYIFKFVWNDMATLFIRTDLFCVQHHTAEVVSFSPWKLDTVKLFLECVVVKKLRQCLHFPDFFQVLKIAGRILRFFQEFKILYEPKGGKPPTNKSWLKAWLG